MNVVSWRAIAIGVKATAAIAAAACLAACSEARTDPNDSLGTGGVPAVSSGGAGGSVGASGTGGHTMVAAGTGGTSGAGGGPAQKPPDAGAMKVDAAMMIDAGDPDACDRACLIDVMSSYLDALVAHDPKKAPIAATAKYTENGAVAMLGQTLWMTASMLVAGQRLDFADPVEGQVASQLTIDENGSTPVIYMVRLKVVKHEITEIEAMSVRSADAANGFFTPANMKPEAVFLQAIEPAKRMTREQLKVELDHYVDYLDGKVDASGVHFDMNCKRYENGQVTASGLSGFQGQSWSFDVVRRYLIFDEEAGIIWGMLPFSMDASTLVVGEAFKIIDGKIMMIQAVMANMPAKAWD